MADCTETLRELEAFLDHELTPETREAIHTHLGDCLDCLQAFDFHAELRDVIAVKCRTDEMPASLMAKIELCFGVDLESPDADSGYDTRSD